MTFIEQVIGLHKVYKEATLNHRYITNEAIEIPMQKLASKFYISEIGFSVSGLPIYAINIGRGSKKVLMWSQMHGNESTTTKAIFDTLNTFFDDKLASVLEACQLCIIPILNPDGAEAYTRHNANDVDLNRDAKAKTQPESVILQNVFDQFQPDFCFNLHGQRTIFSAGDSNFPASVSFLAPTQDEECTVTPTRKRAMSLIVEMYNVLKELIPNQIGIYDDAFNLNCVGDTFQSRNVPTVLFEAGHVSNDYAREEVRKLIYVSLCTALKAIADKKANSKNYKTYFQIPENKKLFFDVLIVNAKNSNGDCIDIAVQYQEVLKEKHIEFIPKVERISNLSQFYAHMKIDANGHAVLDENGRHIQVGFENDFVIINNEKLSLKADKI